MGRPRHDYTRCKRCGRTDAEAGKISGTGRCIECAGELASANLEQLREHAGPYFDHWRERCLAAFGVTSDRPSA